MLHRAYNRAKWYPAEDLRPAIMAGQEPWLERQTNSTSSYARRRPAPPEGLEWRVDGLVPAGRTADVKTGRSVLGRRIGWMCSSGQRQRALRRLTDAGCDYVQQHIELQPLICSALLYSLDPVVGGLCMHILGLSLE
jgi:hypothetical protein